MVIKIFSFMLAAVMLVSLLTSCKSRSPMQSSSMSEPKSGKEVIDTTPLSDADKEWILQNLNEFSGLTAPLIMSGDLFKNKNVLYSPASLYLALSMLSECADADAKDEIIALLQASGNGEQSAISRALMDNMVFQNGNGRQRVMNAIWAIDDLDIPTDMTQVLSEHYEAQIAKGLNVSEINKWINEATDGMIPAMAKEPEPETVMIIINTVFFQDKWKVPFQESAILDGSFATADEKTIDTQYMLATFSRSFIQTDHFAASFLVFENGSRIHFILPKEETLPADLLRDGTALLQAVDYSNEDTVNRNGDVFFKIPKLKFSSKMDLAEALQALGMNAAFLPKANPFPRLRIPDSDDPVYVSDIFQQSAFEMDEEGAKAAAETEIHMSQSAAVAVPEESPPHLDLILNRPFLFVITSPEGYITFVGMVNNPLED